MEAIISDCRNIKYANLPIRPHTVNILYGPNGVGKSTIAEAISARSRQASLASLTPYGSEQKPTVELTDISSVLLFNDSYIRLSLYQSDDHLLNNGMEVFVKTKGFVNAQERTRETLAKAAERFHTDESLKELLERIDAFLLTFGANPTTKQIAKTSPLMKSSIARGWVVERVPNAFEQFTPYINSENSQQWITWHGKGSPLVLDDTCPYYAAPLTDHDRATMRELDKTYGAKLLEHTVRVNTAFNEIRDCFSKSTQAEMDTFMKRMPERTNSNFELFERLRNDALYLQAKLRAISNLGFNLLWQQAL